MCVICVLHVSDTHDVVTRGELRMSEREYILDHTPPWVNNLLYVCYVYVIYVLHVYQTCVRHVSDTRDVVTRGELRMSEREYVLDHTPPWVNNLLYVCYVYVIYVCYMCVRHVSD